MTMERIVMHSRRSRRGQILLVAAFGMIVLLVIAALVIDIGFSVMLRRQEANAADPGSLAAARFIADDQTIDMVSATQAACHYARMNAFFPGAVDDDGCIPANDPNQATLAVKYPPDTSAGQYAGHAGFVQVIISRQQETFFGKILGQSSLTVTTGAVAARQRGETNSHSLIALSPTGCNTANVHGSASVQIYPVDGVPPGSGGYVQVNSDCGSGTSDDTCTNGTGALKIDGTALLTAPKVNVHGSCQGPSTQPVGELDEGAVQIGDPLSGLGPPRFDASADGANCGTGGLPLKPTGNFSKGCASSGPGRHWVPETDATTIATLCPGLPANYDCVHLQPGVYYGGWNIGSKLRVILDSGIYIIAGGGVSIGATGELDSVDAGGAPAPVLLFNTDNPNASCYAPGSGCQQDLDLTAGGALKLSGLLPEEPCPPVTFSGGCPYGRMVIWYDGDGSQGYDGEVAIEGGTDLFISGTIYAPKAYVDIEGSSGTNCGDDPTQTAAVQIISWDWRIGGTGDLCMPYDPKLLYKLNQQGLVH